MKATLICIGLVVTVAGGIAAQKPAEKVDVVAVVGCLKETSSDVWTLANATDPVSSHANAPSPKDIATMPRAGKNEFQLMGVRIFNLPAHRDQTVLVKGLHVKATPTSRLNITSVTMVAASCDPKSP